MSIIAAPLANYNSYASLADAATYHADRGNTAWDDADDADEKAPALIRATDYIDANYGFNVDVIDVTDPDAPVVNPLVIRATALLALYALTEDLFVVRDTREVIEEEDALGTMRSRKRYNVAHTDRFPAVTAILAPISNSSSGGVVVGRLVR